MNLQRLLVLALLLAGTEILANKGNEAHGGGGVLIPPDALQRGLRVGNEGAVELFDTMEYDKEFVPSELAEYTDGIRPKLEILRAKLPRTAHYLEAVLNRGIRPRW